MLVLVNPLILSTVGLFAKCYIFLIPIVQCRQAHFPLCREDVAIN